ATALGAPARRPLPMVRYTSTARRRLAVLSARLALPQASRVRGAVDHRRPGTTTNTTDGRGAACAPAGPDPQRPVPAAPTRTSAAPTRNGRISRRTTQTGAGRTAVRTAGRMRFRTAPAITAAVTARKPTATTSGTTLPLGKT